MAERKRKRPTAKKKAKEGDGAKKALPFQIADILKEGRHGEREFSQTRIVELLAEEGTPAHRDTVKANLELLAGYFPQLTSEKRGKFVVWSWREPAPEPIFDASQARYLADGVVTARRLTQANKAELIELILSNSDAGRLPWDDVLASLDMASRATLAENPEYLLTVEIAAECLQNGWNFAFRFGEVDRSGKFVKAAPEEDDVGPVVPLFLVMANGGYQLACRFPGYEKIYHYRLDLMHDAREVVQGGGAGALPVSPDRYRAEHPYMFGDAVKVTVRMPDTATARIHFFDQFGGGRARLVSDEGGHLVYEVMGSERAMCYWACQYADLYEVLAPQTVRDAVAATAAGLLERYAGKPNWKDSE